MTTTTTPKKKESAFDRLNKVIKKHQSEIRKDATLIKNRKYNQDTKGLGGKYYLKH